MRLGTKINNVYKNTWKCGELFQALFFPIRWRTKKHKNKSWCEEHTTTHTADTAGVAVIIQRRYLCGLLWTMNNPKNMHADTAQAYNQPKAPCGSSQQEVQSSLEYTMPTSTAHGGS